MIEVIPNWHPIWVHFAIGLLIIGTLFYALAWFGRGWSCSNTILSAARWNISFGIGFALLAFATGFLAAGSVPHDDAAHANLMSHRNWAFTAVLIFTASGILLWSEWRKTPTRSSVLVMALLLAGSISLAVTGFKGGQNVYEHGLGVQRLPDVGRHEHARGGHGHGAMNKTSDNHSHDAAAAHSHDMETDHQAAPEPQPRTPDDHSHDHGAHSH